jgi:aminoglycoside phosphotransferase
MTTASVRMRPHAGGENKMSDLSDASRRMALKIITNHYGAEPTTLERLHSEGSLVLRFTVSTSQTRYLKIATDRPAMVIREPKVMAILRGEGLRVPIVEFERPEIQTGVTPYFITIALPGASLLTACRNLEPWSEAALRSTGEFAAHLGRLEANVLADGTGGHNGKETIKWLPTRKENIEQQKLWSPAYDEVFSKVAELAIKVTGVVHGDFNAGQVICETNGSVGVLDWERAGAGNIFHDVGEFAAGMLKFGCQRTHADAFIDGFLSSWKDNGAAAEIAYWEAFAFIGSAEYHLKEGREKAKQRLEWAVETLGKVSKGVALRSAIGQ